MLRHVVSLMSVLMVGAAVLPAQQVGQSMQVKNTRVRMHTAPSLDSSTVTELRKGAAVIVVATQANWIKVKVQGQETTGWVRDDMVAASPAAAADATATTATTNPASTDMAAAPAPPPPPARRPAPPPPAATTNPPAPPMTPPPAARPAKMASAPSGQHGGLALFGGLTSFKEKATFEGASSTSGSASGFMFGFGILAPVGNHFGIEIDFDYLQNGAASTDTPKLSTHVNTASGSFLLRPIFGNGPVKLFVEGGPYFRAAINCSYSPAQATDCKIPSSFNRFGYGAELGAGVMYGRLEVQGRYDIGIANLSNTDGETVKSTGFIIMAGFVL